MKQFFIATQFLTILPITIRGDFSEKDFGDSLIFFPLVGFLIGAILFSLVVPLRDINPLARGGVILFLSSLITGGIHLDGLADTLDGFYGGRDKETVLNIMRDSNIGAIGSVALFLSLIIKFSFFASIPFDFLALILFLVFIFSRLAQEMAATFSNYAREDGKGKSFVEYATKRRFFISAFVAFSASFYIAGLRGLLIGGASLVPPILFMIYAEKRIGGITGDVIGAINELSELTILFMSLLLLTRN